MLTKMCSRSLKFNRYLRQSMEPGVIELYHKVTYLNLPLAGMVLFSVSLYPLMAVWTKKGQRGCSCTIED